MPALVLPHVEQRPAHEWLDSLRHNQQASLGGYVSKVTVADVVDRASDPKAHLLLEPTSPRSVEAFLRHGVEPEELRMHTLEEYKVLLGRADLAELAFRYQEAVRQDRIKAVVDERKRLDEPQGSTKRNAVKAAADNEMGDMVEKEAKRLEVTRRRQERELQQLVHFETARKQQQDKAEERVRAQEARAEAQRQAKELEQADWHRLQHERELGRHKEEELREKEAKALENARFRKEQELLAQEAAAEKQRRRDGFLKEQERIQKVEQARKDTERILAEQQADVDRRKQDMMKRDEKREVAKALRMEEARLRNEEAHAKAAQRIAAALAADKTIQQQKQTAYSQKQSENTLRRLEKGRLHEAARLETLKQEAAAEQQRWEAYQAAQQREEQRITSFLTKQQIKDIELEKLAARREQKSAETALQRQLDLELKHNKVEAMKRRDLYRRELLLQRIQNDTQKTYEMLATRSDLQEQRKAANMSASFERQKLMQSFEKLQTTKKISNTMASTGNVDVGALLRSMH